MIAYLIIFLLSWTGIASAGGPDTGVPPQPVQNIFYCPPVTALTKDPTSRTWSATNGWKSYDLSFVDKITRFSGAQWRGTNVGQILCIYRGALDTDFPIILAYKILTYVPQGGKWSNNLGGYANCESPSQADCPFSIRLQQQQEDIYQQAEQLKRSGSSSSSVGF